MSEPVLTLAQMQAAEQALIDGGTSVDELMQRAGRGAAEWVWRIAAGRSVTVLCGPGNNGGDGYVIAETLRGRGLETSVVAPIEPRTDAAARARGAWQGPIVSDGGIPRGAVLVDCLFGSGLSRPLSSGLASLLVELSDRHDAIVAVDLPSGVETDTGALLVPAEQQERARRCSLTLALGAWKPAHFLMPAAERMGRLELVDIGVTPPAAAARSLGRPPLSAPDAACHKYSRGLVVVVGGPMAGAAQLACTAALRAGAGAVRLATSTVHPATPADVVVRADPLENVLADDRTGAVLVGPGLGRAPDARERLEAVLAAGAPAVLDADALHLLRPGDLRPGGKTVLTPHEGELAGLAEAFSLKAEDKLSRARELAGVTGAVVLAKGPDTVIAASEGRVVFARSATSWLSVAGSGDVLAGITAARLAVSRDPMKAACEAQWLHGESALRAGPAFTASDLAAAVSGAVSAAL